MVETKIKLYPFWEVAGSAEKSIKSGATIYQQFKCAQCGAKQTMAEPNRMYVTGKCEECGAVTNIVRDGCNYLAHIALTAKGKQQKPGCGDH